MVKIGILDNQMPCCPQPPALHREYSEISASRLELVGKVGSGVRELELVRRVKLSKMANEDEESSEMLVKSSERVRDLGEVFTPARIVSEMLDLLPDHTWGVHPSQTFLESSCGDGNFLVAIYDRKAEVIAKESGQGQLEAGTTLSSTQFHLLEALSSIYGVDISKENIEGGVPDHPVGARERLLRHFLVWHETVTGKYLSEDDPIAKSAHWIIWRNIQMGNMMDFNQDGSPSKRELLPLVEYEWHPEVAEVTILLTTFGNVLAGAELESSFSPSLFGPETAQEIWSGNPKNLFEAPIPIPAFKKTYRPGVTA